jgi:hypothetical protein
MIEPSLREGFSLRVGYNSCRFVFMHRGEQKMWRFQV